jgi:hypothetical protein
MPQIYLRHFFALPSDDTFIASDQFAALADHQMFRSIDSNRPKAGCAHLPPNACFKAESCHTASRVTREHYLTPPREN